MACRALPVIFGAILLLSLQRLMNYPVHLGGESALDFAGHAHYLNLGGTPRVRFYGDVAVLAETSTDADRDCGPPIDV